MLDHLINILKKIYEFLEIILGPTLKIFLYFVNIIWQYVYNYYQYLINNSVAIWRGFIKSLWNYYEEYIPTVYACYMNELFRMILVDYAFITFPLAIFFVIFSILYIFGTIIAILKAIAHVSRCIKWFVKEVRKILKKKKKK